MIARSIVGKGVTGLGRYVLGEGRGAGNDNLAPGDPGRVAWLGGQGFGFEITSRERAEIAVRVMEFDAANQASRTKQCTKDALHLMLAWRTGQTPSRAEMEAAARSALKALGMENAKAIWAEHRDEDHAHLHIVASKINPETGRAYNLKSDYLKLSKWAQRYEREHGGTICVRRLEANELREAIDSRDAGAVLEAMTQRRSTFTAADLERALGRQIGGELTRAQFGNAVLDHAEVIRLADAPGGGTTRYTTRAVLEAEQRVLRAADDLVRHVHHGVDERVRNRVLDSRQFSGMRDDQRRAFDRATGAEGLVIIDGQAGTGKSYTLAAIREAYEAHGAKVVGLAPTNVVAQDMAKDGFRHASTVHAELFALNNGRRQWDRMTVVIVDEAAMLDTRLMVALTAHARDTGAKLILAGDDRQLSSIDRGGMFGVLKDRHGAVAITGVIRQHKDEDRRAASMMSEGNFADALAIYNDKGAIHWSRSQTQARSALVRQWAEDSAATPAKSRFVFAYTNEDVGNLNAAIRAVRRERNELGPDRMVPTRDGMQAFARGDRLQFTGTDRKAGLFNGAAGTVTRIRGTTLSVQLDGRKRPTVVFDAAGFGDFRHGYAGTIYKGQGRTIDQTYLYHSEHWRSSASYVALTRHREKTELFTATNTAKNMSELARQMARVDERRAASQFYSQDGQSAAAGEPSGVQATPVTPDETRPAWRETMQAPSPAPKPSEPGPQDQELRELREAAAAAKARETKDREKDEELDKEL